jgi:hypothetical protein
MKSDLIEISIPARGPKTKIVKRRQKQVKEKYTSPYENTYTFHSNNDVSDIGTRVTIKGFVKDDTMVICSTVCILPDKFSKKKSHEICDKNYTESQIDFVIPVILNNKQFVQFAEGYAKQLLRNSETILSHQLKVIDNVANTLRKSVEIKNYNPSFSTITNQGSHAIKKDKKTMMDWFDSLQDKVNTAFETVSTQEHKFESVLKVVE